MIIAVGPVSVRAPDAARRGLQGVRQQLERRARVAQHRRARCRSSCSRSRCCSASASTSGVASLRRARPPGARRRGDRRRGRARSSSNLPALVQRHASTARTSSGPRTCPRTGRRRRSTSTRRATPTRVLEEPGTDFAVVHVGQHRRPDHARAHGPPVRRARADPVRHRRHRRPAERVRPPVPGGGRRSAPAWSPLLRRMGIGDVVLRNDIQYQRYNLVSPRELDRVFAQIPGLGQADRRSARRRRRRR